MKALPVCRSSNWVSTADEKVCTPTPSLYHGVAECSEPTKGRRKQSRKDKKHIQQLERELLRKDKALAETTTLLVLRKRLNDYWEIDNEDT